MPMSSGAMSIDRVGRGREAAFVRCRIDLGATVVIHRANMPTPESAEAFAKLVAARERLTEITRRLNESHPSDVNADGFQVDGARYRQLQAEWDAAFRDFEAATIAFTSLVKHMRDDLDSHHPSSSSGSLP